MRQDSQHPASALLTHNRRPTQHRSMRLAVNLSLVKATLKQCAKQLDLQQMMSADTGTALDTIYSAGAASACLLPRTSCVRWLALGPPYRGPE